jgi:hypothetical protein
MAPSTHSRLAYSTLAPVKVLSKADLAAMVEEAAVDAHDDGEQLSGFYDLIEDNLAMRFKTTVLGVEVTIENISLTSTGIVANCIRGEPRQAIHPLDLPLPTPPPSGAEWIAAYRHWALSRTARVTVTSGTVDSRSCFPRGRDESSGLPRDHPPAECD